MDVASLRFLIVEDHQFQRWLADSILREMGARHIYAAADGRAARDVLSVLEPPVDIVVSDLDMPGMDGIELVRRIAAQRHRAGLIIMTSMDPKVASAVETMARTLGVKCLGTIQKPLTGRKLVTLLAARAVTGIGVGGEWAVAHALVGETVPPGVRGRYGSYLQSGSAFARFFASMMGNILAPSIGWRLAFMLSALPALLVVGIRRDMPESDVWLLSVKDGVNKRLGYVAALGQMLGPALRKTTTLALSVTTFNMAAYWFKTIWLPTYLLQTRGLKPGEVATLLLMDQIGSVAGYIAFGYASDRFGRRPSFTAFSVIKALGLGMITLGWTAAGGYTATTFGFMLLVGFGEGNWGCIGPLLNEVFPTSVRAAALGIIYNTARGVQFLAPVVIGLVAARFTFGAGIALAVPFALLAGASIWTLPETKGVRLRSELA